MPNSMNIIEFVSACEERLKRVESALDKPLQLQSELEALEELLRSEWPDAMIRIKEDGIKLEDKKNIELIFKKIKRIELETNNRVSFFNGIDNFMKEPKIR